MGWDGSLPAEHDSSSTASGREPPKLTYTKPFREGAGHEMLGQFGIRFASVASYFPEIKGEVRVGVTTTYRGLAIMQPTQEAMVTKLCFPPLAKSGLPTRYVMGHEMMHVVQATDRSMPRTERSCDMFTLARLPAIFLDNAPTYLKVPQEIRKHWNDPAIRPIVSGIAHALSIEAIVGRLENPRYLEWWEKEFSRSFEGNDYLKDCLDGF